MSRRAATPGGSRLASVQARTAREVAVVVLHRVCEDGAFASAALDAEIARAGLPWRDAALATQIVYGALRALPSLDRAVSGCLHRPGRGLDGWVRAALRAAAFQLAHLARVPPHAVVDETVSFLRARRGPKVGGFANAVLRKLAALRPANPALPEAMELPPWLRASLTRALGEARAEVAVGGRALPPPLGLRVHGVSREALIERLRAARPDADCRVGEVSPRCVLLRRGGDPRRLPGFAQGQFAVQEEGSQLVALCLDVASGQRVADLCAGHGGKSALLCEQLGGRGELTAVDIDERKLERLTPELARLGLEACAPRRLAVDLTVGDGGLPHDFDRVLVDAPCTGLGTLHRRPELMLRVGPEDPTRLSRLQLAIAQRAASLLRPDGVLVYAVCSPTIEEGSGVADALERHLPGLSRLPGPAAPGLPAPDPDGVLRLGPWLSSGAAGSPDMYQVIRWKVRA